METGTISFFNETKGFGFIRTENGRDDIFVHVSDLTDGFAPIEGSEVEYELMTDPNGKLKAVNVQSRS